MLSLENTSSRMSHLARQEIYFDRQFSLDETLAGDRARHAPPTSARGARTVLERSLAATVRRPVAARDDAHAARSGRGSGIRRDRGLVSPTRSMIPTRYTHPEMGAHLERPAPVRDVARGRDGGRRGDGEAGIVPREAARESAREARFDIARIEEIEATTQHDVIAFTTAVAEKVGPVGPLAALRPHLVGRRRHRAGAPDARGLRPDPRDLERADGGGARRAPTSTGTRR